MEEDLIIHILNIEYFYLIKNKNLQAFLYPKVLNL